METTLREILSAAVVLLVPGGVILGWLPRRSQTGQSPLCKLADAAGLSIAISALLALWLQLAGIRLSGTAVVILYSACGLAILAGWFRKGAIGMALPKPGWRMPLAWAAALLFVVALAAWRMYEARGLALPAWVDSVHHTLLVRKILEWGGLSRDLQPYLDAPLYYHYGFHVMGALFAFLSGSSPVHSVLWFGQVLNAAVALSVYRVADDLFSALTPSYNAHRIIRAVLAAALVGFVFQMPAYYISWGRYTLLAGLVLLGPAVAAANEAVRDPANRSAWIRLALLIAGICLTHYFVLLLLALYMAVLGIGVLYRAICARQWATLGRMALWSGLGILLALPWLVWLWQHAGQQAGVEVVSALDSTADAKKRVTDYFVYFSSLTGPRYNHYLLGFAALGALFGLRRPSLRTWIAWTGLVVFFAMPWGLRVDPFRPDLFAILFFFPAAILLADLLSSAAEALPAVLHLAPGAWQRVFWAALGLPVVLILILGLRQTRSVTNSTTIIANPADVAALDWVQANTPPTARFYINSVPWQGAYRGVDGGYWLAPYTGRGSLIPPLLYAWGSLESIQQVADWAARSAALETCSPDFWAIAREADLSYVYLREGIGKLQPPNLAECPRLRLVYQQGGVYIYQILRPE